MSMQLLKHSIILFLVGSFFITFVNAYQSQLEVNYIFSSTSPNNLSYLADGGSDIEDPDIGWDTGWQSGTVGTAIQFTNINKSDGVFTNITSLTSQDYPWIRLEMFVNAEPNILFDYLYVTLGGKTVSSGETSICYFANYTDLGYWDDFATLTSTNTNYSFNISGGTSIGQNIRNSLDSEKNIFAINCVGQALDGNEGVYIDYFNIKGGYTVSTPFFTDSFNNDSLIFINDSVLFTQYIESTNLNLSTYIYSFNMSGPNCDMWANGSITTIDDISIIAENASIIPYTCADKNIGWRVYANNSLGWNYTEHLFSVYSYGQLAVNLNSPSSDLNISANGVFILNATATCVGGQNAYCGTVSSYARYNDSASLPNTNINTTKNDLPLYVMTTPASNITQLFRPTNHTYYTFQETPVVINLSHSYDKDFNDTTTSATFTNNLLNYGGVYTTYEFNNFSEQISYNNFKIRSTAGCWDIDPTCYKDISYVYAYNFIDNHFDLANGETFNLSHKANSFEFLESQTFNSNYIATNGNITFRWRWGSQGTDSEYRLSDIFIIAGIQEVNLSNPQVSKTQLYYNQSLTVYWSINVTGNSHYLVDVLFNSSNGNILTPQNDTSNIKVSVNTTSANTCDCPTGTDWIINDGSLCSLATTCNMNGFGVRISNGGLRIISTARLRAKFFSICPLCSYSIEPTAGAAYTG